MKFEIAIFILFFANILHCQNFKLGDQCIDTLLFKMAKHAANEPQELHLDFVLLVVDSPELSGKMKYKIISHLSYDQNIKFVRKHMEKMNSYNIDINTCLNKKLVIPFSFIKVGPLRSKADTYEVSTEVIEYLLRPYRDEGYEIIKTQEYISGRPVW